MNVRNIIKKILFYVIILIAFFAFFNIKNVMSKANKESQAIEEACIEVKSKVYTTFGEIPTVSGNIIYENSQDCIIVVSYDLPSLRWNGKMACHIGYGYNGNSCYVWEVIDAPSSDYEFDVEELKVLWKIE